MGFPADFTGIVAFGDSLSDMGNRWLDHHSAANKYRQTWVALLAGPEMFNFPAFKPSGISRFFGGSNYAVDGAGTAATAGVASERNRDQHLSVQVSDRYLNPAFNTDGVQRDALHVVVIGANDIMLASASAPHLLSQWSGLWKAGIAVAQSCEAQIQALANAGVQYLLWGNVFDLSQAPAVAGRAKYVSALAPTYLQAVTKAVAAHNAEMDAAMARLEKAHPRLKIIKLDLFAMFTDIASDPSKYGLKSITKGADDHEHLFAADGLHLTPRGQKLLAEHAFALLSGNAVSKRGHTD